MMAGVPSVPAAFYLNEYLENEPISLAITSAGTYSIQCRSLRIRKEKVDSILMFWKKI